MYEPQKRAYRHPKYKTAYRVKNWSEYDENLRNRGDIIFWLSQDAIEEWTPPNNGKRGGQPLYSDIAIETSLTLRILFHLPLRQAEGFLGSIFKLMNLDLPCPDHTTLSRRNQKINISKHISNLPKGPVSFVVDSTGLKVCGQGEWHSRKHRENYRKRWRKLHIGVDSNGCILASKITEGREQDSSQVPALLKQINRKIDYFVGDGIYDRKPIYEAVVRHSPEVEIIVPPRKNAQLSDDKSGILSQRNKHIEKIGSIGRSQWRWQSGYYLQSHVENVFSRFKRILGGRLRAKNDEAQKREVEIGCKILNKMLEMCRPVSYAVE